MARVPLSRFVKKRLKGFEPSTFCMASRRSSQLSYSRVKADLSPWGNVARHRAPYGLGGALWANTDQRGGALADAWAMTEIAQEGSEREQAIARLKKRRDFQGHLIAYVVVNAALWAIWAATGAGYPWPAWISGGWGIGLILNAWDVYFRKPITAAEIEREMERGR